MSSNSKQLNFWQLLQESKVEIPIIQRDYAQGRPGEEKVRERFLGTLGEALDGEPKELDFIYGSVKGDCFQPLDGQQRLTTLFLLHWYIATKEKRLDDCKDVLAKFTYETRTSSRDFCIKLVQEGIAIEESDKVSEKIKDASWFFLSWKKDPTIKAMLLMLDAIHVRFKDKNDIWEKLIDETKKLLTFYHINLEDFGLSDDLYIKMNARGKSLTAFENFKASFEKKIDDEKWDEDEKCDDGKDITDTFSHKADTEWTDLFWNNARNEFDKAYIRFISGVAINAAVFMTNRSSAKSEKEEQEKTIQGLIDHPEDVTPENFDKKAYDYLCECLNVYSNIDHNILQLKGIPFWQHLSEDITLFSEITTKESGPTYPQRVLFYAQTKYLLKNGTPDPNLFNNWMRVVRNIVHNSTISSPDTLIRSIKLVAELSQGCDDIYDFLSKGHQIKSGFASAQVEEEMTKAKLIKADDNKKKIIFETEDTNFCKGKIDFALYCIDYQNDGNFDAKKLSEIKNVIEKYLDGSDISNKFRRGLLTIGDNKFYEYWGWTSWVHAVDSPKRCLIGGIEDLKKYAYNRNKNADKEYREYLKDLLNQLVDKNLDQLLNDFTPDDLPNWKKRLIKEQPDLLDQHCQSHYVGIPSDETYCYLLRVGRPRNATSCTKIK